MGSDNRLQNGDWDQLRFACGFVLGTASRRGQFHLLFRARGKLFTFSLAEHGHDVTGLQPGMSPVKPTVLFLGEFAELDVITRSRRKLPVLPARYSHGRTVQFPGELTL